MKAIKAIKESTVNGRAVSDDDVQSTIFLADRVDDS